MNVVKKCVDRALAAACAGLFALLVLTVAWQVFSRQVLGDPSTWSEALAKYVFVWLGMLGATLVFSERGHIAVDFVVRKCPAGVQSAAAVVVQLAVIAFASLALIWGGVRMARLTWDEGLAVLPADLGPFHVVMPLAGLLIVHSAVHHLMSVLRRDETATGPEATSEAI